jgi:nucleolar GTP-binding protein
VVNGIVGRKLSKVCKGWPNLDSLPRFYLQLLDTVVGLDDLKRSLGAVNWARKKVAELAKDYERRFRVAQGRRELKREFYGRVASVLNQVDEHLRFLREARRKVSRFPTLEDEYTVVIAGLPNVGKSSLLKAMTGANPRIESYPFTTDRLLLGYYEMDHERYQVIDTPGLLDRRIEERNPSRGRRSSPSST